MAEHRAEHQFNIDITSRRQLNELQRLEQIHGNKVHEWLDEGMPREAMGTPREMRAFRKRKETPIPGNAAAQTKQPVQRSTEATADTSPAGETGVPEPVGEVISSTGRSLDATVQRQVESEMGGSFDDVQIHTGATAASACEAINARAFTVGNHIVFNYGEYDPASPAGQHVLAHELAHVRQQTGEAVSMLPQEGLNLEIDPDPQLERDAETTAHRVMQGGELGIRRLAETPVHVQRMQNSQRNHIAIDIPALLSEPSLPLPPHLGRYSAPQSTDIARNRSSESRLPNQEGPTAAGRESRSAPALVPNSDQPRRMGDRNGGSPVRLVDQSQRGPSDHNSEPTSPVDQHQEGLDYRMPQQDGRPLNDTELRTTEDFIDKFLESPNQKGIVRYLQEKLLEKSDGASNVPTVNQLYEDSLREDENPSPDERHLARWSTAANSGVASVMTNIIVNGIAGLTNADRSGPLSYQGIGASAIGLGVGDTIIKNIIQCPKCKTTNSYFINSSSVFATLGGGLGYLFGNLYDAQQEYEAQQWVNPTDTNNQGAQTLSGIWWSKMQRDLPTPTFLGAGFGGVAGGIGAHILQQRSKPAQFDSRKHPSPRRHRHKEIHMCECENCTEQWDMLNCCKSLFSRANQREHNSHDNDPDAVAIGAINPSARPPQPPHQGSASGSNNFVQGNDDNV